MAKKDEVTSKYLCSEPIMHDGVRYEPGDEIELTDRQAAQLLELNHVAPLNARPSKAKDGDSRPPAE